MPNSGTISLLLIIANIAFSYRGFTNQQFFDGYKFQVDRILVNKDYKRLISSGFLHVGWTHLVLNMMTLLFFSSAVEGSIGNIPFLIVYFASLIGGDLLSLFVHRHHGDYSSVGASGAVCGIMFAGIALNPGMNVGLLGFPLHVPGWLYGIMYVAYSIYGIKSKKDNIGHDAHLGGALVGMLVALLFEPSAFAENSFTILIIAVPAILFIYFIVKKPQILLVDNLFYNKQQDFYSIDHQYNAEKNRQQKEIDFILDKISSRGMNSLTKIEKEKLEVYSKKLR